MFMVTMYSDEHKMTSSRQIVFATVSGNLTSLANIIIAHADEVGLADMHVTAFRKAMHTGDFWTANSYLDLARVDEVEMDCWDSSGIV